MKPKLTIQELKKMGFQPIPELKNIFINRKGEIYNPVKCNWIKPDERNYLRLQGKNINVPKMILYIFGNQPIKPGKIIYSDGNKKNLNIENLKYCRLFENSPKNEIDKTELLTAIRCYYEISPNYTVNDKIKTGFYIYNIAEKRNFIKRYILYIDKQYIEIFKTYLKSKNFNHYSISQIAKQYDLNIRDCNFIINAFLTELINEILTDLKAGLIIIKEFEKKPKKPSKKELLNDFNSFSRQMTKNREN